MDPIKTICKFRVVGVENTGNIIFDKHYEDQYPQEVYDKLPGTEYTDRSSSVAGRKYKSHPSGKFAQNIRLAAQYDTTNPEDVSFAAATPSGTLSFYCDNPQVVGTFHPNDDYYIELTPCFPGAR